MNILCLDQFSDLGGGQLSLLSLLPGLKARGWNPLVAIPDEGPFAQRVRALGIEVYGLRSTLYGNGRKSFTDIAKFAVEWPRLVYAIEQIMSQSCINLLYVNAPRLLPASSVIARLHSIPLVFHCHNRLLQRSGIAIAGESLRFSRAHVIACCKYAAAPIHRYVRSNWLSVQYSGVDKVARRALPFRRSVRKIGVIGRIEREKGQLEFVRASRTVLRRFPDCHFFLVGKPLFSTSRYFDEVAKESSNLPVEFLGWHDDIAGVLTDIDLLVVPSSPLDSAPRVIFEAFSSHVPVLAFPSGGIPEIIRDNDTGFLTEGTGSDALASRICSILEMKPESLRPVTDRAWRCWQQQYTLDLYRDRVAAFLLKALQGYS